MQSIRRETLEMLRRCVRRGEVIPSFFLAFLRREIADELVGIARSANNTRFLAQLDAYLNPPKAHTPQKLALVVMPKPKVQAPRLEQIVVKGSGQQQPANQHRRKRRKKRRSSTPKAVVAIVKPWEPPQVVLGKDTTAAAKKPTVFTVDGNRRFVYVGGTGSSPVQSDKAASLPREV